MIVATSDRVLLRSFTTEDCTALEGVFCDPEVMRFSHHGPQDRDYVPGWIEAQHRMFGETGLAGRFAVIDRATGHLAGYAGLLICDAACGDDGIELSYRLRRDHHGRGLATEAARLALRFGFAASSRQRAVALIDVDNLGSINVARKLGMTVEGFLEKTDRFPRLGRRVQYGIRRHVFADSPDGAMARP